jgi:hypothetical protein
MGGKDAKNAPEADVVAAATQGRACGLGSGCEAAHIGHVCVAHAAQLIHLRVRGIVLGLDGPAARACGVSGGPEQVLGNLKVRVCHERKGRNVVRAEGERGCGGTWWRAEDEGPMSAMEGRCCMPTLLRLTRMVGAMRETVLF